MTPDLCAEPGPWCEGRRYDWTTDPRGYLVAPKAPDVCAFFDLPPQSCEVAV